MDSTQPMLEHMRGELQNERERVSELELKLKAAQAANEVTAQRLADSREFCFQLQEQLREPIFQEMYHTSLSAAPLDPLL